MRNLAGGAARREATWWRAGVVAGQGWSGRGLELAGEDSNLQHTAPKAVVLPLNYPPSKWPLKAIRCAVRESTVTGVAGRGERRVESAPKREWVSQWL